MKKCAKCGKKIKWHEDIAEDEKGRDVCIDCFEEYEEEQKSKKKENKQKGIFQKLAEDYEKRAQYVRIINPITLGMQIAIGMFIMFPLFIIAVLILLLILGVSLEGILGA